MTRTVFIALALFAPLLAPADELINQPPDNPLPPKPYADGCEGCGDCSEGTETGNDCVSFSQRFGRTPLVAGAPVGRLRVVEFTAARLPAEVSEIAVRTAFSDEASDPARLTALLVLESGGHPKALEAARRLSALRQSGLLHETALELIQDHLIIQRVTNGIFKVVKSHITCQMEMC